MKIIVCVKQIARIYVHTGVDVKTKELVTEGFEYMVNPYDEVAVEAALQIRDESGEGEVTVISFGPDRVTDALQWCLAMGADRAVHIVSLDPAPSDPWLVSKQLSQVIRQMPYDLLLFGKMAMDDQMGQVGYYVGEDLGVPVVTSAADIILRFGVRQAEVQRALERGNREVVTCPLPALFTVEKCLNRPRYPTLPGRRAVAHKQIDRIVFNERTVGSPLLKRIAVTPPKIKPKKILSPDSQLSAVKRMQFILTGGVGEKKGGKLGGDSEALAEGIFNFLLEKKFVPTIHDK